jgi:ketosteroid isomerase-like protein
MHAVVDGGDGVGATSPATSDGPPMSYVAPMSSASESLRSIATQWLDCFARADLEGLLALYADDAVHTSPKIRVRHPETGGVLRGKPALRAWWADAFARLPGLGYELVSLTADDDRVFMEYVRHAPGEPDLPVAEVLDVTGGVIVASRVYHG